MRKAVLLILLCATTLTVSAQTEGFLEKLYQAKLAEMVLQLNLSDEQKAKFEPVYRAYNEEMHKSFGMQRKGRKPQTDKKEPDDKAQNVNRPKQPKDVTVVAAKMKERLEHQKAAIDVRIKYVDEFAKVLDGNQLFKFWQVENQMQHKFLQRREGRKGKPGKRPVPASRQPKAVQAE